MNSVLDNYDIVGFKKSCTTYNAHNENEWKNHHQPQLVIAGFLNHQLYLTQNDGKYHPSSGVRYVATSFSQQAHAFFFPGGPEGGRKKIISYIIVNWWFGARWFGYVGSPKIQGIFGILRGFPIFESQTTNQPTPSPTHFSRQRVETNVVTALRLRDSLANVKGKAMQQKQQQSLGSKPWLWRGYIGDYTLEDLTAGTYSHHPWNERKMIWTKPPWWHVPC